MPQQRWLFVVLGALGLLLSPPAAITLAATTHATAPGDTITPGQRVQWPTMITLQGQTLTPDALQGRMVLLQIWASWCPYCSLQNASLPELQRRWEAKGGRLITVSTDKEEKAARDYLQRKRYDFPTVMMPVALKAQLGRIKVVPTILVIGPDGTVLKKIEGQMLEEDLFELADRLPNPRGGSQ